MASALRASIFGAAAFAAVAIAPAAHAGTYLIGTVPDGPFAAVFGNTDPASPSFDDTFPSFVLNGAGYLTGSITSSTPGLTFSLAVLDDTGTASTVLSLLPTSAGFYSTNILAGTYQLHVTGDVSSSPASYSGTLNFAPVPEPATWALMLLGFGAIGFGLRRRKANVGQARVRVQYS